MEPKPVWRFKKRPPPRVLSADDSALRPGVPRRQHSPLKRGLHYKPQIVAAYYRSQGLPVPLFEFENYIPGRKFRLDIAWPQVKVGVEVCGGIWAGQHSHASGKGITRDMEKRNLAIMNDWAVLEFTPQELCMQGTVDALKQLIQRRMVR